MAAAASIQHPARLAAMTALAPDAAGASATNDFAVTLDAVVGRAAATPDRPSRTSTPVSQNAGPTEAQGSAGQAPAAPALSDVSVAVAAVRSSPTDTKPAGKPAGKAEAPAQPISTPAVTDISKAVTETTALAGIAGLVAPPAMPLTSHGTAVPEAGTAAGRSGAAPAAPLTSAPPGATGAPATAAELAGAPVQAPATAAVNPAATPAITDPAMAAPLLQGSQAAAMQPGGSPAAAAKRTAAVTAGPSGSASIRGLGAVVSVTLTAASSVPATALAPAPASAATKDGATATKTGKLEPYHAAVPASGAAAMASDATSTGLPTDSAPTAAPDAKGALPAPAIAMAATIAPGDGAGQPSTSLNRAITTDMTPTGVAGIGGAQQPAASPISGPSSADAGPPPANGGFPPPAEQIAPALVALAASRAAGTKRLSVTMAPVELGRVAVTVERVGDGPARISVTAERPETLQLLQREHTQLSQLLDNAGVGAEGRSLSFSLTGGNGTGGNGGSPSQSGQGQPNGGGWPQGQPRDTAETTATPPARWQRSGVDITA